MVVVECSVPDCTFTTDDVSEALAIALLSNHNLAHCNLAPIVADAAPAPTAPRSSKRITVVLISDFLIIGVQGVSVCCI